MTSNPRTPSRAEQSPPSVPEPTSVDPREIQSKSSNSQSILAPVPASKFYGSHGSSYTGYIAPNSSPYREPQLIQEDPAPELVPPDQTAWPSTSNENWNDTAVTPWDSTWSGGLWPDPGATQKLAIDGRSDEEELNWSDAALQEKKGRPGPGMLPPMLADMLHDPDHALYSVSVSPPPPPPPPAHNPFLPTPDEVRTAVPYPQAYYCREHNGWVLLIWRSSTVLPPLLRTFNPPLPDMARRKRTSSCVGDGEQPFGQANITHHWHHYDRAVDARKLNPPFMRDDTLLDLYLCCQCSTYCMVSEVIPGVIPASLVDEFTRDKLAHPVVDRTPKASVLTGWETFLTIVENRLWKNEQRTLSVQRPRFQYKIGWNGTVRQIFEVLGFPIQPFGSDATDGLGIEPPQIDAATPEGKQNRAKLLRAWVEIGAWLAIFNKSKSGLGGYVPLNLHADVTAVREMYQTGIGAHVSQIPRGLLPDALVGHEALDAAWKSLGITPASYSWELLSFAYLAQCRCDPAHTPTYFTHLYTIVQTMVNLGEAAPELQQLIVEERARNRYTHDDLCEAVALLGFGKDHELGVELDHDVDDSFILQAWRSARRRAWQDNVHGSELRMRLNDALRFIADDRGSEVLKKAWEEEKGTGMTPDAAYATLEVPKDVDESMLITICTVRIEDQPSQAEKMREALSVIAEFTDSERLRQFLATGLDPGDVTQNTSPDMPRGLNQLGNTCYLNSLLQYFYTIKDLRQAIAPLAIDTEKSLDDGKVTDDDLKRHRVGGRLVTRREVLRSKRFVHQLAELFWNMEYSEVPAVTPTIDLAKLALVTSQDEEEDDQDRTGTDSSNDTDATLVEDAPPRSTYEPASTPLASPTGSVLGKRHRELQISMDVDSPLLASGPSTDEKTSESSPPTQDLSHQRQSVASSSKLPSSEETGDIEMVDSLSAAPSEPKAPPPLPSRKPRPADDSVMMFGRQHDVSECMDNCMFQIETALLDFQEMADVEDDKTSVVKKKRQRLTPLTPSDDNRHKSSIHEKEDLFSHLHVNVSDEGFDLYDGLARYFDDVVDLEGTKKRMEVSLVDLPPLLQIQLQRVQFDRETQQAYKSQAYVKFDETIYMDRFLDTADPAKKAQAKALQADLNAARDRIHHLTQDKHAPFPPALGGMAEFLSKQDVLQLPEADEELVSTLRSEERLVISQLEKERNNALQLKAQIEQVWKDDTAAAYELTSVFIHRGSSPSWGHYFFYSRNLPNNPNQWFKYNDSDVSIVSEDEVLADTTGSTANPYMLVFTRKGSEAIQTVHRFDPEQLQDG